MIAAGRLECKCRHRGGGRAFRAFVRRRSGALRKNSGRNIKGLPPTKPHLLFRRAVFDADVGGATGGFYDAMGQVLPTTLASEPNPPVITKIELVPVCRRGGGDAVAGAAVSLDLAPWGAMRDTNRDTCRKNLDRGSESPARRERG
jgi:hypothetical protein